MPATMRSPHRRSHRVSMQQEEECSVDQQSQSSSYSPQQTQSIDNIDDDGGGYEDDGVDCDDGDGDWSYASSSSSLLPSTYVNVAPLPVFSGTPSECPLAHLSRFRRVCRANNASSPSVALRIFPATLDGHAALWCDLAVGPSMTWAHVRSAFLSAFLGPDSADRARAQLMGLRQAEGESSGMFHLRMRWILKKWPCHGLPDSLLRGVFVDGLREDFQDWIVPQRPETLEEAVRLAANWESRRAKREAVTCGFCEGTGHEERGCEVKRKMRELWLRSKSAREETAMVVGGEAESGEGKRGVGEGGGGLGRVVSLGRKGQGQQYCQCLKHQCWKKYVRSSSVASDKHTAGGGGGDQA